MYRLVIRWSFNGDAGSVVRNKVANELKQFNVKKSGTGAGQTATFEGWGLTALEAAQATKRFWDVIGEPAAHVAPPAGFHVDHVWIYMEVDPRLNQ